MTMTQMESKERYFLLPMGGGGTLVVNNIKGEPDISNMKTYEGMCVDYEKETLDQYISLFPEETRLKVALFEEMLRSMPNWTEQRIPNYDSWYQDIKNMAVKGIHLKTEQMSLGERIVLEWLLLSLSEPKVRCVHESCYEALLELAGERRNLPTKAYLLEYQDPVNNCVDYGFISPRIGDILPLIHCFDLAGQGWGISRSLEEALARIGNHSFPLAGHVSPTFRCVLMVEFQNHVGLAPLEVPTERQATLTSPELKNELQVLDARYVRVLAVLLYQASETPSPPGTISNRGASRLIVWLTILMHTAFILHILKK